MTAGGSTDGMIGSPSILDNTPPPPPSAASSHGPMTTRGIKRLAGASVNITNNGPVGNMTANPESRKRRRHNLMHETMRKIAKKREATQKMGSTSILPELPVRS